MSDPRRSRFRPDRTRSRSRSAGGADGSDGGRRRSGPDDEEQWWVPADQALAEAVPVSRRTLGRGWRTVPMINNVERVQPFGSDPASAAVEAARTDRRPTGLDEGRAWRHRNTRSLVVVRSEVYADADPAGADRHRAAWREHAEAALDATWRERWHERERQPAWIEARWAGTAEGFEPLPASVDWLRIEDHTPTVAGGAVGGPGTVTVYEHLTAWAGRRQVTVVIRHDIGVDLDALVVRCAGAVARRLTR